MTKKTPAEIIAGLTKTVFAMDDLVDTYMELSEKMAEMKAAQDSLKEKFEATAKLTGAKTVRFEGTYGYVSTGTYTRNTVNWKKIAVKLGVSKQMVAGNTKKSEYVKIMGYMFNKTSKAA